MLKMSMKFGLGPTKNLVTLRFLNTGQDKLKVQEYVDFLSRQLTIDKNEAKFIVQNNKSLLQVPQKQVARVCRLLKKYDVDVTSLPDHGSILTISPLVVESRILAFQELGVPKITVIMLKRVVMLFHQSVIMFKACTNIPRSQDPFEHLLKYIKLPPDALPMAIKSEDVKFYDHYKEITMNFLQHRLQISRNEAKDCFRIGQHKFKSFRFLQEAIDIVEKEIHITKSKMLWLIKYMLPHPGNLKTWLYEIKPIAGESIASIVKKQPSILAGDASEVEEIREILRERNISEEKILKFPLILKMSADVVRERLDSIARDHAFQNIMDYNSDILKATYMYKEMQIRAKYLQYIGMGDPSTTFLLTSKRLFERYTSQNFHSERKVLAIKLFLQKDKVWDNAVGQNFKKHPYWKSIPETQMYKTYLFLKKRFSPKDIIPNIQILLYSESSINRVLQKLDSEQIMEQYQYTQCQYLALCLYHLEKDVHFSGDGIWAREKREFAGDESEIVSDCEDSDGCDTEDKELYFQD